MLKRLFSTKQWGIMGYGYYLVKSGWAVKANQLYMAMGGTKGVKDIARKRVVRCAHDTGVV